MVRVEMGTDSRRARWTGVHATPEVRVHHLTEKDKFMVICSDGVWEFLSVSDPAKRATLNSVQS